MNGSLNFLTHRSMATASLLVLSCLLLLPLISMPVRADNIVLGSEPGSKVHMESDLNLLMDYGGGHVYWIISGPVVKQIRNCIDLNYGNSDGTVSSDEGIAYTTQIDNYLTAVQPQYHGASITSFSLLTKNIESDTRGLMTSVNATTEIEIDFLLRASSARNGDYSMSDPIMVNALFEALQGGKGVTHHYSYVGKVEIKHISVFAGFASFSNPDISKGTLVRMRGPGIEFYQYTISYDGSDTPKETISYSKFDPLRSSVELFIILLILGYLMLYLPKRYARIHRKRKVKAFHWGNLGLIALSVLVFIFAPDGIFVLIITPILLIITWGLSHKIYAQGYRGWAKPMMSEERLQVDSDEGVLEMQDDMERSLDGQWTPRGGHPDDIRWTGGARRRAMHQQWQRKEQQEGQQRPPGGYDDRMGSPKPVDRVRAPPGQGPQGQRPVGSAAPVPEPIYENQPEYHEPRSGDGVAQYSDTDIILDGEPDASGQKVNVRCSKCRQVFTVLVKRRPTRIVCDKCGQEGMLD